MARKQRKMKSIDRILENAETGNENRTGAVAYCYIGANTLHNLEKGRPLTKQKRLDLYLRENDILYARRNFEPFRSSPGYHSYYVNNLVQSLNRGEIFIVASALDLSGDAEEFLEYYKLLWDRDIDARFLDCSWLDIRPFKENDVSFEVIEFVIRQTFSCKKTEKEAYMTARREAREQLQATGELRYNYHKNEHFITDREYESQLYILENNMDFGKGHLSDPETMKSIGISRNSYYKYKKNLRVLLEMHHGDKSQLKKYLLKELKQMKDANLNRKRTEKQEC